MTACVSVEVSPGELIDKITILEIKLERIEDADKLANVKLDWETLSAARDAAIEPTEDLERLSAELKQANERQHPPPARRGGRRTRLGWCGCARRRA